MTLKIKKMMPYSKLFFESVNQLLSNEGGYVNDPKDPGGETNWGISKRSYPEIDIKNLTKDEAIFIYYRDWWNTHLVQSISHERLQSKVFDISVNIGKKNTIKCLQRAIQCALDYKNKPIDDGIFGNNTLKCLNNALFHNKQGLYYSFKSEVAAYYRLIGNKRFLNGWLKRAYSA